MALKWFILHVYRKKYNKGLFIIEWNRAYVKLASKYHVRYWDQMYYYKKTKTWFHKYLYLAWYINCYTIIIYVSNLKAIRKRSESYIVGKQRKPQRLIDDLLLYVPNRYKLTSFSKMLLPLPCLSILILKVLIHEYAWNPEGNSWGSSTLGEELNIFQYLSVPSWLANIQIKIRMLMKTKCNLKSKLLILWNCLWFFNCKMMLFY